ncbi:Uma2 family endonuclease [Tolypothrix sp. PCC 7910]|uniref:Uma2 family endonuclease n=1 Tax=Tolypothrix sp. PCC 7910 TaxID=2099387 RepID=UPI0035301644
MVIGHLGFVSNYPLPITYYQTLSEICLIIEVADSSLKLDCEIKGKSYLKARIRDYWVLDVVNCQLQVVREPTDDGYQSEQILSEDETISPLEFPDLRITVLQMLPLVNK